jgi:IclR family transcriptional regulator, KDG regulon repressor
MKKYPEITTKSVEKTFDLLEMLCKSDHPLELQEISQLSGLPSPTVYRLLQTLLKLGYIRQKKTSRQYYAGLKIFELSQAVIGKKRLTDVADEYLQNLSALTQETIHLAVLDGAEVIYLQKYESHQPITLYSRVGRKAPSHCTGVGKVLLAFLPQKEQAEFLKTVNLTPYTSHTIIELGAFEQELEKIRSSGYALDNQEHEEGIHCLACPIKNELGEVIAAVSVTTPVFRVSLEKMLTYLPALMQATMDISKEFGYVESID